MDRKNRLNFCKVCIHQKNDLTKGLICGLTNDYPTFDFSCIDYKQEEKFIELNEEQEIAFNEVDYNYETKTKKPKTSKKTIRFIFGLLLINTAVIFSFYKLQQKISPKQEYKRSENNKPLIKKKRDKQPKAIQYFASDKRIALKRKRVNKDTSFMVAKHLKIVMHKKYYMSIAKNDMLPVLAISRGYSFIHNKVKTDKSKSLIQQWVSLRKDFSSDFEYTILKEYEFENMKIIEVNFTYNGYRDIYGASKLVEIDNNRYFFHFAFKQQTPDFKMLRKYLNYYVKVR